MNPQELDTIAVLDFGGQYAHLIANRLRRLGVYTEIVPSDCPTEKLKQMKGLVFSGGPSSVYTPEAPPFNPAILQEIQVPILGICYGHQQIAHTLGGSVRPGAVKEYGISSLKLNQPDHPLFQGIPSESPMWMSHGDMVQTLPAGFHALAVTEDCPTAAVAHENGRMFGLQFHPEVTHSQYGSQLLKNFITLCGCQLNWNMKSYLPLIRQRILDQVGDRNVFLLVSGGVDSTVAFVLLNEVLGPDRVLGLHIDNGMMRLNESAKVLDFLNSHGIHNLRVVDASEEFLTPLQKQTLPEIKRKSIGASFLEVKDRELAKLNLDPQQWMIAQGTIYPDTIESGGTQNADLIKTHHNRVDAVMELMQKGLLLEPLADLYKDEVRYLGEELGIPHHLVWRHPFPGPGLGVRLLCSDGHFDGAYHSTDIAGLSDNLQQLNIQGRPLPLRSVGVQGDARTYAQPILLQSPLSWDQCERYATSLCNRFGALNRAVWQVGALSDSPELVEQYCEKTHLDVLRQFDDLCNHFLEQHGFNDQIWQMPVVLLPLRVAGKPVIVMRPVDSSEAMTASFSRIPQELLEQLWQQLKDAGAGALYYDITHKPPGTIEWE